MNITIKQTRVMGRMEKSSLPEICLPHCTLYSRITTHLLNAATLLCVLGTLADNEEHGVPEEAAQKEKSPHRIE